jgi:hypothetical protein
MTPGTNDHRDEIKLSDVANCRKTPLQCQCPYQICIRVG